MNIIKKNIFKGKIIIFFKLFNFYQILKDFSGMELKEKEFFYCY